jgi:hypothetical protein
MISTSESNDWIKHMCRARINGGRPEGWVLVIKTSGIRTPIRRALTKVLPFAYSKEGAEIILQRIGTEWWVFANIPPHAIKEVWDYENFLTTKGTEPKKESR